MKNLTMRIFLPISGLKSKTFFLSLIVILPILLVSAFFITCYFNTDISVQFLELLTHKNTLLLGAILSVGVLCASIYVLHRYWRGQLSFRYVKNMPFPAVISNRKGQIVVRNHKFTALFPEVESHVKELLPFLSSAPAREKFAELTDTVWHKNPGDMDFYIQYDNTFPKPVQVHYKYHNQLVFWTFVETTKEGLLSSETEFQQAIKFTYLFNSTPSANVILDEKGVVQGVNETFKTLFQKHIPSIVGTNFIDFLAPSCAKDLSNDLISHLKTKESGSALDLEFASGSNVIAYISQLKFQRDEKQYVGYYLQIFDNSEQRNIQLRLAHSQKLQALGQLAGGIAHDFNNLLTAMIGFCDLMLMRLSPGDQSFTDIMQIKQNANRATNLVRQLLAFSRQQTLQPTVLNVSEVLSDLSILLQRLIGSSVELKMTHGHDVDFIRVDRSQFEQVIINLIVNAKDAIHGDGIIKVSTELVTFDEPVVIDHETIPAGSFIQIKIVDDGQGISRQNLQRVFDPFFSTKAVGEGTGLGLATAYGTVKQTGGHISVDSTVGVGTKFTILLPQFKTASTGQRLKNPSNDSHLQRDKESSHYRDLSGNGSILLAEDEDAVRLFACRALRDKGYQVEHASHGQEALDYLKKIHEKGEPHPDLLITDVVMPKMDGPTLVKEAEKLFPDMKVMYISGYAEDAFRDMVNLQEKIRFLSKPFSLKVLAARVKETLEGKDSSSPDKNPESEDKTETIAINDEAFSETENAIETTETSSLRIQK